MEVLHEWEPNDKVKEKLKLYRLDHIVVGFDERTGQRVRGIRRDGAIVDSFEILTNVRNLYYRLVDVGACDDSLRWLVADFDMDEHVDTVFENAVNVPWMTWWFDRFYTKSDAEAQIAYFLACEAYERAYRKAWAGDWDARIIKPKLDAATNDWKDALRDFYLPALRAWVITYNPDRPYIRV